MKMKWWIYLVILAVIPALVSMTGCVKKKSEPAPSEPAVEETAVEEAQPAEEAVEPAAETVSAPVIDRNARGWLPGREKADIQINEEEVKNLTEDDIAEMKVSYRFDSYAVSPDGQYILRKLALWLENNPEISVILEGHCDERGTNEYNTALGARRADFAKQFVQELGIDSSRLTTISYGEERPLDEAHTPEGWALNRRVNFVIR